jgi:glucose-6-phosphate 1-dehydrogenase
VFPSGVITPNHFRFRISPEVTLALGMMEKSLDDEMLGEPMEMIATRSARANDMDAYERVLRDAMAGDATLFAREDYVEEAWRIVDPVLKADIPVYEYEPGTWGPSEVEKRIVPADGWDNPVMTTPAAAGAEVKAA